MVNDVRYRETAEKTTKAFNLFGSEKEDNQEVFKCSESRLGKQKFGSYFKNHSENHSKINFEIKNLSNIRSG